MAFEALLARVPVPPEHVHRIPAEMADAAEAASAHEEELRRFFRTGPDGFPRFDLILLGLGADAHTASLFPGSPALRESRRLVLAPWVPQMNSARITMTPPVLNHAAVVLFIVSGKEKAEAARAVLEGPRDPDRRPAQIVEPEHGEVRWLLDAAAASRLTRGSDGG
jgi:6-phosphogluconolactonase